MFSFDFLLGAAGVCLNNGLVSIMDFYANGNMQTNKFAYEEDFVSNSGMLLLHFCT